MSEEVKPSEKVVEAENCVKPKKRNYSKTSKEVWLKLKVDYDSGNYKSMRELSERYGVSHESVKQKVFREKWNEKQITLQNKVYQAVEQRALSLAEKQASYLERLSKRGEKYEQIIDRSLSQIGELVDPEAIDTLTRSELRVKELSCTGLRIPTLSNTDITTGGKDLATSFIAAIAKLREAKDAPRLTSEDLRKTLDAEIVE